MAQPKLRRKLTIIERGNKLPLLNLKRKNTLRRLGSSAKLGKTIGVLDPIGHGNNSESVLCSLAEEGLLQVLEDAFRDAIFCGEELFMEPPRLTVERFRLWIKEVGLTEVHKVGFTLPSKEVNQELKEPLPPEGREAQLLNAFGQVAATPTEHGSYVEGIHSFARMLQLIADIIVPDKSMKQLMTSYIAPYHTWLTAHNASWDGYGIDADMEVKLMLPDVSSVLTAYEKVLQGVFDVYRRKSTHSLEDKWSKPGKAVYSTVIETEELRSLLKTTRVFPTLIAYCDIITLACACNKHVVTSQTLTLGMPSKDTCTHVQRVDPAFANLDFRGFLEFLIRLAQKCHRNSDLPSLGSRLEKMLRSWDWMYEMHFRRQVLADVHRVKNFPTLLNVEPSLLRSGEATNVTVTGTGFTSKSALYVKVGTNVVNAAEVTDTSATSLLPAYHISKDTVANVRCIQVNAGSVMHVTKSTVLPLSVSINGFNYSRETVNITVELKEPPFVINCTTQAGLHKIFLKYTKQCGAYNVTHISHASWEQFKVDHHLEERLQNAKPVSWLPAHGEVVTNEGRDDYAVIAATFTHFLELLTMTIYHMELDPAQTLYLISLHGAGWQEQQQ